MLSLDLSDNELNGSIPRQVFDLRSLTTLLDLSRNSLTGSIPQEIGRLENVAQVDLSHNTLVGNIPDTISSCRSLEVLSISHNRLSGSIPGALGKAMGLRVVDLSCNQLSGSIPTELGDLQSLQFLNMSFNNLEGGIPDEGVFTNTSNVHLQGNPRLCMNTSSLCPRRNHGGHHTRLVIAIIAFLCGSTLLIVASIVFFFLFFYRRGNSSSTSNVSLASEAFKGQPRMVTYEEIMRGTNNFDPANLVGTGGFGSVYKGTLGDGVAAAIKVLDLGREGASKSFAAECEALRNVRHRNLVKLVTSCSSVDFKNHDFCALVYEFMANGSLEDWVRGRRQHEGGGGMDVVERLGVAVDVASAMDYLHHDCEVPVVHGDLKPSNVMMGVDMVAKVGDFGLAKMMSGRDGSATTTHGIKGSIGYIPPEYGLGRKRSTSGDVYSYGIMLLELFTGKSPTDSMFAGDLTLERWVRSAYPTRFADVLDPALLRAGDLGLRGQQQCLASIIAAAVPCTAEHPDARPDMRGVLHQLKDLARALLKP